MTGPWPETTSWGLGGAPLAGLYHPVDAAAAEATVTAAWDAGVRLFDTAPHYGAGLSEERMGAALGRYPRDQLVLSTKVGRLLVDGDGEDGQFPGEPARRRVRDYSAAGVRRSLEDSLMRLGLDRVDVVYVHDPDEHGDQAIDQAVPALVELRDVGVVRAIGVGMNQWRMLHRFVTEADIDVVMVAGRWTLLDRSAAPLLEAAAARGVAVVAAGVLNSGILADPEGTAMFDYAPASQAVTERVARLAERCAAYDVPLLAAALQFPLRHPAVRHVVVGARSAQEVAQQRQLWTHPIPDALWDELDAADPTG